MNDTRSTAEGTGSRPGRQGIEDLRALLDAVGYPLLVVAPVSQQIEYANEAVGGMLGVPAADLAGRPLHEVWPDVGPLTPGPLVDSGPGEESFRVIFEQAPVGAEILRVFATGERRIVRANEALAAMFRERVEDLVGSNLAAFGSAEQQEEDREIADALASGRATEASQLRRYRRADGTALWAEARAVPIKLPDLEGPLVLVLLVDVTERQIAAERRAVRGATAEVVNDVVAGVLARRPLSETYDRIVRGVARAFRAENVALGLPQPGTGEYVTVAGVGDYVAAIMSGRTPTDEAFVRRVLAMEEILVEPRGVTAPDGERFELGPGAAVRVGFDQDRTGLLAATRRPGDDPFTPADLALLYGLADQLAVAVQFDEARLAQERLAVLEDRQRLARDLHDTVIQDLIAAGMQVERLVEDDSAPRDDGGLLLVRDTLEQIVQRLRAIVFQLGPADQDWHSLETAVRKVVADAGRALGHRPELVLRGPVDELSAEVGRHVAAVLREALSNVVRHARATHTWVTLVVTPRRLTLTVEDDGAGLPSGVLVGQGLANIEGRARGLGGSSVVRPRLPRGTRLRWTVPLAGPVAHPLADLGAGFRLGGVDLPAVAS